MTRVYSHRRSRFGNPKKAKPMEAMYAAGVSIFSVLCFIVILIVDVAMGGDTPRFIGGLSVIAFLISLSAFIFNIGQMRTQTEFKDRLICLLISIFSFLIWLSVFVIGMVN